MQTDLELGDQTWATIANGGKGKLAAAVAMKTATEERINQSVSRILHLRFVTGQFDPIAEQPYTKIGAEAVNSTLGQQLNLEAALQARSFLVDMSRSGTSSSNKRIDCAQSFVLLKNEDKTLPMAKGKKTAILGPHVHSTRDLMSDYKGDEQCNGGGSDFSCFPTIAQAFTQANGAANTLVEQGVDMSSNNGSGIPAALAAAKSASQVLLFIGIGNGQEHEGIDRHNTSLPGLQEPFALQVLALCKQQSIPAAVVLINGGAVAIDPLVPAATAIVEAFYPSVRGAEALTLALFGAENRFGKLPVTLYDKEYISQVDFHDFHMSKPPVRRTIILAST